MSGSSPNIVTRPFFAAGLLLAACSEEPIPLPSYEDLSLHRECACVTRGDCVSLELIDGTGEHRNFQCRWTDRQARRAICNSEDRFKPIGGAWSKWERSEFRFRHLGEKGWCWDRRGSEGRP
ncbi:MAG TPA: hypothetical protein VFQ67_06565 [Allosphingosinicella sp.]|jgi:hypothetical protein|nr:hypothetical protein [Allosphingosinicella sp.]